MSEYTMSEIIASIYDMMERTGLKEGIRYNEKVFLYMIAKQNDTIRKAEYEKLKKTVADGKIRMKALRPPC